MNGFCLINDIITAIALGYVLLCIPIGIIGAVITVIKEKDLEN